MLFRGPEDVCAICRQRDRKRGEQNSIAFYLKKRETCLKKRAAWIRLAHNSPPLGSFGAKSAWIIRAE